MELAEDLEDPGDLAPRGPLGPPLPGALEIGPQVAVLRVLEREAVEDAAVVAHQREARRRRGSPGRVPRGAVRSTASRSQPSMCSLALIATTDGTARERVIRFAR